MIVILRVNPVGPSDAHLIIITVGDTCKGDIEMVLKLNSYILDLECMKLSMNIGGFAPQQIKFFDLHQEKVIH